MNPLKDDSVPQPLHLEELRGWDKLQASEQETVRQEDAALVEVMNQQWQSQLAGGRNLVAIQKVLHPRRIFVAYLKKRFHRDVATAYRWIELYRANEHLAPAVLEAAIDRGFTAVQLRVIADNPLKGKTDPKSVDQYLDEIVAKAKKSNVESIDDPDALLKECLNFVSSRYERLPKAQRTRTNWVRSLLGMQMTRFGMATEQTLAPVAIPDWFKAVRGRPKAKAA